LNRRFPGAIIDVDIAFAVVIRSGSPITMRNWFWI